MHYHPYSRAVQERTYVNRAVDDAHAWLVDNAQGIEDETGVPIPVDFYTLNRMRQVRARYGDPRIYNGEPTDVERRMMQQYQKLMYLYANRDTEPEPSSNFGSWALIVAILAPWVLFAIVYGLWRWLN